MSNIFSLLLILLINVAKYRVESQVSQKALYYSTSSKKITFENDVKSRLQVP